MKIIFLAPANAIHTKRWVESLVNRGIKVLLASQHPPMNGLDMDGVEYIKLPFHGVIGYFLNVFSLQRAILNFRPDLLHVHYASGYGTTAAIVGFKPTILSVWGSDIFEFPNVSFLNRLLLRCNLMRADKILSTSHAMALETNKYTNKLIEVTPFGIDLDIFKPDRIPSIFAQGDIVVGTVKTLEEKYGIEYLIRAFQIVKAKYLEMPLKLLIVGGGLLEKHLKSLADDLGLNRCTVFTGFIPHSEIPKYHNMLSVSVSVSNSESFGVAIIEACACEKPVVVSDVGGLPEVVEDGVTGIVVPSRDVIAIAAAIERLILDDELRQNMGRAGRERVKRLYDWNDNVSQMIDIYKTILAK